MILVKLSKGPSPKTPHHFREYVRWAERNTGLDGMFEIDEEDLGKLSQDIPISMTWKSFSGLMESGTLNAMFFEPVGSMSLKDFL